MSKKKKLKEIIDRFRAKQLEDTEQVRAQTLDDGYRVKSTADNDYITVRYDLLRFLLSKQLIDTWQFAVGRNFQGLYLQSLIQPPRCALNMDGFGRTSSHRGYARMDVEWPHPSTRACIKRMAGISQQLSSEDLRIAKLFFCRYSLEDETSMKTARPFLHKNPRIVADLLDKLGWAMGMTTRNPYKQREAA